MDYKTRYENVVQQLDNTCKWHEGERKRLNEQIAAERQENQRLKGRLDLLTIPDTAVEALFLMDKIGALEVAIKERDDAIKQTEAILHQRSTELEYVQTAGGAWKNAYSVVAAARFYAAIQTACAEHPMLAGEWKRFLMVARFNLGDVPGLTVGEIERGETD